MKSNFIGPMDLACIGVFFFVTFIIGATLQFDIRSYFPTLGTLLLGYAFFRYKMAQDSVEGKDKKNT